MVCATLSYLKQNNNPLLQQAAIPRDQSSLSCSLGSKLTVLSSKLTYLITGMKTSFSRAARPIQCPTRSLWGGCSNLIRLSPTMPTCPTEHLVSQSRSFAVDLSTATSCPCKHKLDLASIPPQNRSSHLRMNLKLGCQQNGCGVTPHTKPQLSTRLGIQVSGERDKLV